jgi:hypothetical protein
MVAGHSAATSLFGSALNGGGQLAAAAPGESRFQMYPMQVETNEIRMLSVKKEQSLASNF